MVRWRWWGRFLVGRDAFSYVRTAPGYATDAVQEAVPVEFQVDRARRMVEDLVPEVRKNMHVIAKEEIEVERLDEQIADAHRGWRRRRSNCCG